MGYAKEIMNHKEDYMNALTVKDCQRMGSGSDLLKCTLRHCADVYGKPAAAWDGRVSAVSQADIDWLAAVYHCMCRTVLYDGSVRHGISIRIPGVGVVDVHCPGAACDQWDLYAGF